MGQKKNKEVIIQTLAFDAMFRELFPDNCKDHGNALCPWHNDTTPSLQLYQDHGLCHGSCKRDGKDRKAYDVFDLWQLKYNKDFTGAYHDLLGKAGLVAAKPKGTVECYYEYTDEAGLPLHRTVRYRDPKSFSQEKWTGSRWMSGLKDCRVVPFRLRNLAAADEVWIVEGEKDVLALEKLGFTATTNPMGSKSWRSICKEGKAPEVFCDKACYICPDVDSSGETWSRHVAESLYGVAHTIKILRLPKPGLPDTGDVSDFIQLNGGDAKGLLLDLVRDTKEIPQPERSFAGGCSVKELLAANIPPTRFLVDTILPEGLTMFAAVPKAGKTCLCLAINLVVQSGRGLVLDRFRCNAPGKVLHIMLEDTPAVLQSRFRDICQHDPEMVTDNSTIFLEWPAMVHPAVTDEKMRAGCGLDKLRDFLWKNANEYKLVIIDPLARFWPGANEKSRNAYLSEYSVLAEIQQLAKINRISIIVVHHLNKGTHDHSYDKISGSAAFQGAPDSLWILSRPDLEKPEATLEVTGKAVKSFKAKILFGDDRVWRWEGMATEAVKAERQNAVWHYLENLSRPVTAREVGEEFGCSQQNANKVLKKLADAGQAIKVSSGWLAKRPADPEDPPESWNEV